MESPPPSPWQAPPPWLATRVLHHFLVEPRWPLLVESSRLITRGWRDAIGESLPALELPRYRSAAEAAAAAALFPSLRLLQLDIPALSAPNAEARQAQQAAALATICASCTGLRHLAVHNWSLPHSGFLPLAGLAHLTRLDLCSVAVATGGLGHAMLPPLPLAQLRLHASHVSLDEVCQLTALTCLELSAAQHGPLLVQRLAQALPLMRELTLADLAEQQSEHLPCLAALPALTSLSLSTSHDVSGLPLPELQQLLSGDSLRGLELIAQGGFNQLPLAWLTGLQSLALAVAELQVEPPSCVSYLTRLTELRLNAHALSLQADDEDIDAFVGAIGRRLTGLRSLSLTGAQHLSEAALLHISGLTSLTDLSIVDAHDFGRRAFEALRPLASLRRLSLADIALNPVALAAVLDDEDDSGLPLLPAVTLLSLSTCRLLSAPDVARWVCSLSSLRRLRLASWPHMDQMALEHILLHSSSLQLLQTAWRPPPAPHIPAGTTPDARELQELLEFRRGQEFCRTWRLKLQHSCMLTDNAAEARFENALAQAVRETLPA